MKYIKTTDGKTVIKDQKNIIVFTAGLQTINPSHDMLIEDGWLVYEDEQPTEEDTLRHLKEDLRNSINEYDQSAEVNSFTVSGVTLWLDKATRAGLMLRFQAEIAAGLETTALWHGGVRFPLALGDAMQMLYALELYASACYDNTQRHLAAVDAMTTADDIETYDITEGYPEKLAF